MSSANCSFYQNNLLFVKKYSFSTYQLFVCFNCDSKWTIVSRSYTIKAMIFPEFFLHIVMHCLITPSLSRGWDQNRVNSTLYIAFWSVEPTDIKNVIIENISPALSLYWPACLLKFYRKQKQRKFYNEKL